MSIDSPSAEADAAPPAKTAPTFAEVTRRLKPTTRSVLSPATQSPRLTLFRSPNERTLVFNFAGHVKDVKDMVTAIAGHYGDQVSGAIPLSQVPRLAVTFKPSADLAAIEKAGFVYNSASIPIYRTYAAKANLLLVTLLNTPVTSAGDLSAFLKEELAKYGAVHDIRLCYWPDTPGYLMARAVALFDLDKSPEVAAQLPSFIRCPLTDQQISLHWRGAPPACRYCKRVGHFIGDCRKRMRHSKRPRTDSSADKMASAVSSAQQHLPAPGTVPISVNPSTDKAPSTSNSTSTSSPATGAPSSSAGAESPANSSPSNDQPTSSENDDTVAAAPAPEPTQTEDVVMGSALLEDVAARKQTRSAARDKALLQAMLHSPDARSAKKVTASKRSATSKKLPGKSTPAAPTIPQPTGVDWAEHVQEHTHLLGMVADRQAEGQ